MRQTTTLLLIGMAAALIFACSKDDPAPASGKDLIGKWKLVEIYADPGDGSGTFIKTDFNKTVEFHSDGNLVVANGDICRINIHASQMTRDTYTLDSNMIVTQKCDPVRYHFDDKNLVITMNCIEGCAEKYQRLF